VSSTAIPPAALNRLAIPQFDSANQGHRRLVQLALRLA
jgi:hypothetical protein